MFECVHDEWVNGTKNDIAGWNYFWMTGMIADRWRNMTIVYRWKKMEETDSKDSKGK